MTQPNAKLVEVARAIEPNIWNLLDLWQGDLNRLDDFHRADIKRSLSAARRAVGALMEPSEDMVRATGAPDNMLWRVDTDYRAMLAKVLEEEG